MFQRVLLDFVLKTFGLGAENETRTRDPNLGKVVLYQLSYFRVLRYYSIFKLSLAKVATLFFRARCALPTELFLQISSKFTRFSAVLGIRTCSSALACTKILQFHYFYLVKKMRLELTRPNGHYPLKVARLPIPPLLHSKTLRAAPSAQNRTRTCTSLNTRT